VANCFKPASKYNLIKMGNIFLGCATHTADKKDTVLNVLNIVYEQFQVGVFCDHVVVVGDGKSYDLVIK
jgi:hypothetical protein